MGRRETRRRRRRRRRRRGEGEGGKGVGTLTDLLFNITLPPRPTVRLQGARLLFFSPKKKLGKKNTLLPLDSPPLQSDCFLCLANNNHLVLNEAAVPPEGSITACAVAPPAGRRETRKSGRPQHEVKSTGLQKNNSSLGVVFILTQSDFCVHSFPLPVASSSHPHNSF